MHTNSVKIGRVIPEILSRTDKHAHTQTDRHIHHNTPLPIGGGVTKVAFSDVYYEESLNNGLEMISLALII